VVTDDLLVHDEKGLHLMMKYVFHESLLN
jgi:hypothetical protein